MRKLKFSLFTLLTVITFTVIIGGIVNSKAVEETTFRSTDGLYDYELDENDNATIIKYNGIDDTKTSIVLSSKIDEHPVVSIGPRAVPWNYNIISVTIPSSLVSISDDAFTNCFHLYRISIDGESKVFLTVDGILYNYDKTRIWCYPNWREKKHL